MSLSPAGQSRDTHAVRSAAARIAVDVGGTTIKGAAFTDSGVMIARHTEATFGHGGALESVQRVVRAINASVQRVGRTATGIGVASPGLVDAERGRIVYAANLGWEDLDVVRLLADEFALPVHIDHDARAGAMGERADHMLEADAYRDFIFVPIGTGVAAAVVAGGHVVRGATGGAGEFGHMPIVPGGELCGCGQHGCIEAYASASSVHRRYLARGGLTAADTPHLVASLSDDPVAAAVWGDLIEALALGLSSLAAVLDPARIVIGGGLSRAGAALMEPLRASVDAKLGWRPAPAIVRSTLGSHSGLIGAAIIADPHPVSPAFATAAAAELSAPAPNTRPLDRNHQ